MNLLKKLIPFCFAVLFCGNVSWAQCPAGDIILDSEQDISDFIAQYPNCTEITGNVYIGFVDDISPLTQITSIEGILTISYTNLVDLNGLNNLTSVGTMYIGSNPALVNLTGLESLNTADEIHIGYFVYENFVLNDALTSLEGLDNLTSVEGTLELYANRMLTDLTNLSNLTSVGYLKISSNRTLANLTGLDNLVSLDSMRIGGNDGLITLMPLENIDPNTIANISIRYNRNLLICHVESICGYLANGGVFDVIGNAPGCRTPMEIETACASSEECGITLRTQTEVDNFAMLYPDCTELGHLTITSQGIHDLSPLTQITSIEGALLLLNTHVTDFTGLNNLTSVGTLFISDNDSLVNLIGLENLNTAGNVFVGAYISTYQPNTDWGNRALISLNGLDNLASVGELAIHGNPVLSNIGSLSNVTSAFELSVLLNSSLVSLNGLENLTSIASDLNIWYNDSLVNLTGLNGLTSIGNHLFIRRNNGLTDLTGLNALTSIGRDLDIGGNANLIDFNGLNNLTLIGDDFLIAANDNLFSLSGLDNLTSIGSSLFISGNDNLTGFGLPNLTSIGTYLWINDNENLVDLDGLENLMSIGDFLRINFNYSLTNLDGLSGLTSVGGYLQIGYNDDLSNLNGLSNLTSIAGRLHIHDNASLTSLEGLENIDHNGIDPSMSIYNNPLLALCSLPNLCDYLEIEENKATIHSNAPNCNNREEVLEACDGLPIELNNLQVYLENDIAVLEWETLTEINNAGFEIQKSKNSIDWEKIGWQAGQGNTLTPQTYIYRDENPFLGKSYYQLKQVDFDGDFEYSNVVSLQYIRPGVTILPNPSTGIFEVQNTEQGTYQILSTSGQIIQEGNMQNDLLIDISREAQGVYFISVTIDSETFVRRIVKM